MSKPANKKGFGVYVTILAAILALAAGIYFQVIGGTFGLENTHNGNCYEILIVALLVGAAVIPAACIAIKRYGLASAAVTACSGVALCLFIHKCYWYVVDVFVGIDEKHGFDPKFMIFTGLVLAAFVVGEVAIYCRKTKKVKA